jgi:hypothetical protein
MNLRAMTSEEQENLEEMIKNGTAKQVHFGSHHSIFKPRGSMKKNSLGYNLLERLDNEFEHWSDPKYADNPEVEELIKTMHSNMMMEVLSAWELFIKSDKVGIAFRRAES